MVANRGIFEYKTRKAMALLPAPEMDVNMAERRT
jgi:hypothetical protein